MEISELEGQEKPQFFAEFFCIKGQDLFCFFTLKSPFVCKKIVHNDVIYPSPIFPSNEWNELRVGKIWVRGKDERREAAEFAPELYQKFFILVNILSFY